MRPHGETGSTTRWPLAQRRGRSPTRQSRRPTLQAVSIPRRSRESWHGGSSPRERAVRLARACVRGLRRVVPARAGRPPLDCKRLTNSSRTANRVTGARASANLAVVSSAPSAYRTCSGLIRGRELLVSRIGRNVASVVRISFVMVVLRPGRAKGVEAVGAGGDNGDGSRRGQTQEDAAGRRGRAEMIS
jgi:hypothetical protein